MYVLYLYVIVCSCVYVRCLVTVTWLYPCIELHQSEQRYTGLNRHECVHISFILACRSIPTQALKKELHDEKSRNRKLEEKIAYFETIIAKFV